MLVTACPVELMVPFPGGCVSGGACSSRGVCACVTAPCPVGGVSVPVLSSWVRVHHSWRPRAAETALASW